MDVTAGTGLPTEVLAAVLERLDVPAASLLPPVGDPHSRPLALPGVGRQDLSRSRLELILGLMLVRTSQ